MSQDHISSYVCSLCHFVSTASDREEWEWLQSHVYTATNDSAQNLLDGEDESVMESSVLLEFIMSVRAAATHLLTKLNIPLYRVRNELPPLDPPPPPPLLL